MSSTSDSSAQRFDVPSSEPDDIRGAVQEILHEAYVEIFGDNEWTWEVDTIHVDEVTIDEKYEPHQNAALEERSRAVARAQLYVGEARPLIALGENNKLVDGHAYLSYLTDELDGEYVTVYRAVKA